MLKGSPVTAAWRVVANIVPWLIVTRDEVWIGNWIY
jgi:hypothetical protein